jgi:hypothetical protein
MAQQGQLDGALKMTALKASMKSAACFGDRSPCGNSA